MTPQITALHQLSTLVTHVLAEQLLLPHNDEMFLHFEGEIIQKNEQSNLLQSKYLPQTNGFPRVQRLLFQAFPTRSP